MKRTSWVALAALVSVGGFVVYTSFFQGGVRCEVCITFEGRDACRAVEGANERDALAAARTNACAQLTSGVTSTMACERTDPRSVDCRSATGRPSPPTAR
jgi:hypothetical protein